MTCPNLDDRGFGKSRRGAPQCGLGKESSPLLCSKIPVFDVTVETLQLALARALARALALLLLLLFLGAVADTLACGNGSTHYDR
eukprot:2255663-Rhodomonas_salina.1